MWPGQSTCQVLGELGFMAVRPIPHRAAVRVSLKGGMATRCAGLGGNGASVGEESNLAMYVPCGGGGGGGALGTTASSYDGG